MGELEKKAYELAKIIYANEVRIGTKIPKIKHVENIVNILKKVKHSDEMLASAWLFDALDKLNLTNKSREKFLADIRQGFGIKVAKLLDGCMPKTTPAECGKLIHRITKDIEYQVKANAQAQSIKLADVLEYLQSIRTCDFYNSENDGFKRKLQLKDRLTVYHVQATKLVKADASIKKQLIDTINLVNEEIENKLLMKAKGTNVCK